MNPLEPRSPSAHVPAMARTLADPHFPNGERAALKRMGLEGPSPLALYRFILDEVDEPWQSDTWTRRWRALLCALAIQRDGGFDPSRPWGKALAEAGFAESRLERLLAAQGDTQLTLALRAARQLAAKGLACDWRQLADLIFSTDPEIRERINTRIARDYYHNLEKD
ncbi:MAG: CRISPR type I-E protein CasB/Cse2 [Candidatus Accumulibacter adjunctus]|uniref:CRISPR type I-E protein CasB/Cse2 n=1 Tax=Candidatus Accumulibacter adjunctus TaxID=1454001 RepID=A0A011MVJ7_9PROT|nr:MAG: CRISPR type I-E protein CasB/Cse2 [Candidatus Accumulibacter adjunctus]